jgi:triphosphoribosyl-dephospho-CoA synthase
MYKKSAGDALQQVVLSSFLEEVNALKPGNVSRFADGHGMTLADFTRSAELVTPILCDPTLSVGQRIQNCVEKTKQELACNTNLGMLLLFAPLIRAAEFEPKNYMHLQQVLSSVLQALDTSEATLMCEAIRLANPGGLGQSDRYDVNSAVECGMLEVMTEAQDKDSISRQYVTNFQDIFSIGLVTIKDFNRRWNSVEWATVACYMTFLANYPDSHIQRKYGKQAAENTRKKASLIAEKFKNNINPDAAVPELLEYDTELKKASINPGTSADLTAASVLVYKLIENKN